MVFKPSTRNWSKRLNLSNSNFSSSLGRGVFVFDEDFSPCRLHASLVSLRFGHARGKTTLSCFLTLSRRFATRSTAQMRTPLLASSLGERIREPLTVAIKIGLPTRSRPFLLAQAEGFEPPCRLGKRFSRPPRCDHFDKPAYFLKFVFRILALASIFGKAEIFLSQCKIVLLFKC